MLRKLEKLLPNIDPDARVVSGFSSGGAAVIHMIAHSKGKCQKYFYGFMPGGSGWDMGGLGGIKGRPMLAFMGDKDRRFKGFSDLVTAADKTGVDVKFLVFKGVDHSMPRKYYPEMRKWLMDKVVLRDLGKELTALKKRKGTSNLRQSYLTCLQLLGSVPKTRPEHKELKGIMAGLDRELKRYLKELTDQPKTNLKKMLQVVHEWGVDSPHIRDVYLVVNKRGEELATALLADETCSPKKLKAFIVTWGKLPCAEPVKKDFNERGEELLKKLRAGKTSSSKYITFAKYWAGYPCAKEVIVELSPLAEKELLRIQKQRAPTGALMSFLRKWQGFPICEKAQAELTVHIEKELAEIGAVKSAFSRRHRLKSFIKKYKGTPSAKTAAAMLAKL
jgi:hypothetical protein